MPSVKRERTQRSPTAQANGGGNQTGNHSTDPEMPLIKTHHLSMTFIPLFFGEKENFKTITKKDAGRGPAGVGHFGQSL